MTALDYKLVRIESSADMPIIPLIMKFGGIGSVIIVLIRIFEFSTLREIEFSINVKLVFYSLIIIAYVLSMTMANLKYKKVNQGFLTLSKAFKLSYATGTMIACSSFLASLIYILIFSNTGEFENLGEIFGFDPYSSPVNVVILAFFASFLLGCILGAIVALFISLATRKERPVNFSIN